MQHNTIGWSPGAKKTPDHRAARGRGIAPAVPRKAEPAPIRLNGHVARRRSGPVEQTFWDTELTGCGVDWVFSHILRRI
jgi:hypothetical protein